MQSAGSLNKEKTHLTTCNSANKERSPSHRARTPTGDTSESKGGEKGGDR